MNWIEKLERKFGRFGIRNLTMYIIGIYVAGFLLQQLIPGITSYLTLDIPKIFAGQVWRLITWVLFPPGSSNVFLFALAIIFFYYPVGTSMEMTWGTFRYTLYVFMGFLITTLGAFVLYFIMGASAVFIPWGIFTTYYITLSIILAYALTYPEHQVLLWFVIPIKMKWMAYVYLAIMAYNVFSYIRIGYWFMSIPIICSLLNLAIFYFTGKDMSRYNPKDIKRRRDFAKAMQAGSRVNRGRGMGSGMNPGGGQIAKHKCAICGRTELDDPNLEFRFCSRCNGNYEYCQDHLFTHQHKV